MILVDSLPRRWTPSPPPNLNLFYRQRHFQIVYARPTQDICQPGPDELSTFAKTRHQRTETPKMVLVGLFHKFSIPGCSEFKRTFFFCNHAVILQTVHPMLLQLPTIPISIRPIWARMLLFCLAQVTLRDHILQEKRIKSWILANRHSYSRWFCNYIFWSVLNSLNLLFIDGPLISLCPMISRTSSCIKCRCIQWSKKAPNYIHIDELAPQIKDVQREKPKRRSVTYEKRNQCWIHNLRTLHDRNGTRVLRNSTELAAKISTDSCSHVLFFQKCWGHDRFLNQVILCGPSCRNPPNLSSQNLVHVGCRFQNVSSSLVNRSHLNDYLFSFFQSLKLCWSRLYFVLSLSQGWFRFYCRRILLNNPKQQTPSPSFYSRVSGLFFLWINYIHY